MKYNMNGNPVITIHIKSEDKQALKREAESKGLQLVPYCRMILLESLKSNSI